jgi:hypothetical protein
MRRGADDATPEREHRPNGLLARNGEPSATGAHDDEAGRQREIFPRAQTNCITFTRNGVWDWRPAASVNLGCHQSNTQALGQDLRDRRGDKSSAHLAPASPRDFELPKCTVERQRMLHEGVAARACHP